MDLRTDECIDKDYKSRIIEFPETLAVPDNEATSLRALNLEMFEVKDFAVHTPGCGHDSLAPNFKTNCNFSFAAID